MKDVLKAGMGRLRGKNQAIIILGAAALILSAPGPRAAERPATRYVRCSQPDATIELNLNYQTPGSSAMGLGVFARPYREGDPASESSRPDASRTEFNSVTTIGDAFGKTEVTFTIKQVPGPDRLNPYQIVIHAPFLQNISGTIDGTRYEATWSPIVHGGDPGGFASSGNSLKGFTESGPAGPVVCFGDPFAKRADDASARRAPRFRRPARLGVRVWGLDQAPGEGPDRRRRPDLPDPSCR